MSASLTCSEPAVRQTEFYMAGPWEIIAHGPADRVHRAIDAAFHEIERIESLLSRFRPDSEISRINRETQRWSGPGRIRIDAEVCRLLGRALRLAARTGGAFDPTTAALKGLWNFAPDGAGWVPPDPEQIRTALKCVGFKKVQVDETRGALMILEPGLEFDLGGMGKGYAVDRAVAVLKSHGIQRAWVSCGSTAFGLGAPMGQDAWRIGIRDPRRPDRVIETIGIRNRAISTSAAYEQFSEWGGKRFGHICDPRTGRPAGGPASVTVLAPAATKSDVLSTAVYVMGTEEGMRFLQSEAEIDGCFVEEESEDVGIRTTPGWNREARHELDRRRFLTGALAALGLLALRPFPVFGTTFLTEDEAFRQILPEGRAFQKETLTLTAAQKEQVNRLLGKKIEEDTYTFHRAKDSDLGKTIGYGVVLEVVGKERPITFLVGVSPQARVVGLEVLIYRESQGSEIRSKRFMRQFIGKTVEAPLKLGRDIDGISGATLSSRSTTYAVKKALALTMAVYGIRAEGGV